MGLNNRFDDGKPESCTISIPLSGRVDAIEPVEQMREVLASDRRTRIGDTHEHVEPPVLKGNSDLAPSGGIPDRIAE